MEGTPRDQNFVTAKFGVLNTDTVQGQHLVSIKIDEATGAVKVNTTATISFTMVPIAANDQNYVNCATWMGTDGLVYPWVVTASGEVLIDM